MRRQLPRDILRLASLLKQAGLPVHGKTDLFVYCRTPKAATIHHKLTNQGLLARLFTDPPALRFGLPPADGWAQLERALSLSTASPENVPPGGIANDPPQR